MDRIFLTVGGQLPFDRLVAAADAWAGSRPEVEIFAQIGETEYRPHHFDFVPRLTPSDFRAEVDRARGVASHAGMGTVFTVLGRSKPLLVLPRLARLGECRSNHQVDTARYLEEEGLVRVATGEEALGSELEALCGASAPREIHDRGSSELIKRIRDFISSEPPARRDGGDA